MPTPKEVYALRAAMRWAWSRPPRPGTYTILRTEFRERKLILTPEYIAAFAAATTPGFSWDDPCATKRPLDKFGQPIWRESRLDTLRRAAWIKAAEELITITEDP